MTKKLCSPLEILLQQDLGRDPCADLVEVVDRRQQVWRILLLAVLGPALVKQFALLNLGNEVCIQKSKLTSNIYKRTHTRERDGESQ